MRRSVEQHLDAVRALLAPAVDRARSATPERVAVDAEDLLGRVTAIPTHTEIPLPPFTNSQMDGYAVLARDLTAASSAIPVPLRLGRTTAAGDAPGTHEPGTASPVMTGAAIPRGADAVVPVEHTTPPRFPPLNRAGDPAPTGHVTFNKAAVPGQFVRVAGEDAALGTEMLAAGVRLNPARIGLLASAGVVSVPVLPRIRILLCSTGDELTARSGSLAPGRIHDANTPMIAAALRSAGAEVRTLRTGDTATQLLAAISETCLGDGAVAADSGNIDLIVTTGGISAGAFEVVREAFGGGRGRDLDRKHKHNRDPLEPALQITPDVDFVSIAMQPGGPQGLGTLAVDGGATGATHPIPVLCFPGNPVSAALSAELFLLPTLRQLAGLPAARPHERRALAHAAHSPADKLQLRRGRLEADGRVALSGPGSHLLSDLAHADVLAHLPAGTEHFAENDPVLVWRLND